MARTPSRSSTDDYAKLIARSISRGRPPSIGIEIDRYCESSPREIFAAFAGAARHMPPSGKDEALGAGYLFLLQRLLDHLRYRSDQGYADAAELIAEFQADVVARIEAEEVQPHMLAFVGAALHESKIPASTELVEASIKYPTDQDDDDHQPLPGDLRAALDGILEACGGDPFMVVGSLIEGSHTMPAGARGSIAGALALAGNTPEARSAAILFLLDPDPAVRHAVVGPLDQVAASLGPADVRRLIAMRNWRPKEERADIDAVIRKARAAGIDCAQWPAGGIESVVATAIDGVSAQGFLLVSPAGRKKRISSILTKGGIADAWSGEPESRRQVEANLAAASMGAPVLKISRPYLDRAVAHHLALGIEKQETPPLGLLRVAETIGGADWQPARMAFGEALAGLVAEIPKAMCAPAALASVLRSSDELADLGVVGQSWFEDDPQVAQVVASARGRDRAKLATYLLQSVFAQRRDRWAEIVLRTALWMREAPAEANLCWREFALVAKALADGHDMAEIGVMRDIALRTIAVLRSARKA